MKKFVCCYMVKNHILPNTDIMKINGERKKKKKKMFERQQQFTNRDDLRKV